MISDSQGEYNFIDPLPVALLPYDDMQISIIDDTPQPIPSYIYPYNPIYGYFTNNILPDITTYVSIRSNTYNEDKHSVETIIIHAKDGYIQ